MTVLDLAAAVAIGNLIAACVIFGLLKMDRVTSWSDVSLWTAASVLLPVLFLAASIYLIA